MKYFTKALGYFLSITILVMVIAAMLALSSITREQELKDQLEECKILLDVKAKN